LKREADIWKYINRKRDKIWKENNIKDEEWRKYFKELLDDTEVDVNKVRQNTSQLFKLQKEEADKEENKEENEEELKAKEIGRALCKMKKKKVAGKDDVPMEAWIYAGKGLRKRLVILQKV